MKYYRIKKGDTKVGQKIQVIKYFNIFTKLRSKALKMKIKGFNPVITRQRVNQFLARESELYISHIRFKITCDAGSRS